MSVPLYDQQSLSDRNKGLALAVSSSIFIGSSFIVKKKGLRAAGATGIRAGRVGNFQLMPLLLVSKQHKSSTQRVQAAEAIHIFRSRYGGLAC